MARFFSSDAVLCAAAISVVLGLLSEQPAHASPAGDSARLLRAWAQANHVCRGNLDPVKAKPGCVQRDLVIAPKLRALGWIYGWEGDVMGACQVWHLPGVMPDPDCYL